MGTGNRIGRAALVAALIMASACGGRSQPDQDAALREMVAQKWAAYSEGIGYPAAGGAVLLVSSPAGDHFVSTGMENASPGIHFRIASNTKTFTAAAIMLLNQRGLLRIDDPITASIPGTGTPYVPDTPSYAIPYKDGITIRKLLSHTAGVYDVTNDLIPADAPCPYAGKSYLLTQDMSRQFTFDELVGVVAACNASYGPPSEDRYHYSNTGYTLLGKVIERVSGLSYSEFVTRNLLVPDGLVETSSPSLSTETAIPPPFAVGYSLSYLDPGKLVATASDSMSINVAEGNLISTPQELARWNRALLTGTAGLDDATVGAHNGYLSMMAYDPGSDVSIVLFFSLLDFGDLGSEARLLLDVVTQARSILGY